MLKITKSLMTISLVAALAIGVTTAYFSDKEVSKGNTFTAGTLDLKIDSECHFNGAECICRAEGQSHAGECYWDKGGNGVFGNGEIVAGNECYCVWDEKDLTDEKFFNFTNLLPGDQGEATISMHVIGDDAYVRFKVDNIKNYDNGCNVPERKAEQATGSVTCGNPGSDVSGELGANMDFAIWFDMGGTWGYQGKDVDPKEGDNILNGVEKVLVHDNGNASAGQWVELINPYTDEYIPFGECKTYYIGVAWCVGDMVNPAIGDLTCDGSGAGNIIQSDSYISDSIFEVVQATHNDNPGSSWPTP